MFWTHFPERRLFQDCLGKVWCHDVLEGRICEDTLERILFQNVLESGSPPDVLDTFSMVCFQHFWERGLFQHCLENADVAMSWKGACVRFDSLKSAARSLGPHSPRTARRRLCPRPGLGNPQKKLRVPGTFRGPEWTGVPAAVALKSVRRERKTRFTTHFSRD